MQPRQDSKKLNLMFHALADASRRAMVDRLGEGPASVSELARPLAMTLPSVVKHLGVLEAGGLVLSEKAGRVRTYRIAPGALGTLESWVLQRKAKWQQRFDQLEQYRAEPAREPGAGDE